MIQVFKEQIRLFVLSFKDDDDQESHKQYYLPSVEIKYCNVLIDGRNFLDQPIKDGLKTYDNIKKIAKSQGGDYTTGCLLDYVYFKEYYKLIAKDLSKQQKLDADPKAIQRINFTGNLDRGERWIFFFIIKEAKESVLDFQKEQLKY